MRDAIEFKLNCFFYLGGVHFSKILPQAVTLVFKNSFTYTQAGYNFICYIKSIYMDIFFKYIFSIAFKMLLF